MDPMMALRASTVPVEGGQRIFIKRNLQVRECKYAIQLIGPSFL
jgi:hypothetical protein